jgi:predicted MFS family arabinose efflux permease
MNPFQRFPKVEPYGMTARVFLAFLTTAGFFYVNIMPTIVDGLIQALGFTNQQAGTVGSANMYGAAFGALGIVFLVKRIDWQTTALGFLIALIALDLLSMAVESAVLMTGLRFVHGLVGGALVGIGFSVIARTREPDRTFGVLLFVQFGLGGLGVMFIPGLVPLLGTKILFLSLVAFTLLTLFMLPFLPAYERAEPVTAAVQPESGRIRKGPLALTLAAIVLFQAANMGLYACVIGMGSFYGLEGGFVTTSLGVAAWLGLAGAGLVVLVSDRLGYFKSLLAGIALTVVGTWALLYSDIQWIWIVANCAIGITWAYAIAYLLGLVSRFDTAGQMAALGGFASKMGLASGPVAAGLLLGQDNYPLIIWVAVIGLVVCLLAALIPAWLQDSLAREKAAHVPKV